MCRDERGIVEFLGRDTRFVEPGFHTEINEATVTRVRDVRGHTMDLEPQPVITKEKVEICVGGSIWVRPGRASKDILYRIADWKAAVVKHAKAKCVTNSAP